MKSVKLSNKLLDNWLVRDWIPACALVLDLEANGDNGGKLAVFGVIGLAGGDSYSKISNN